MNTVLNYVTHELRPLLFRPVGARHPVLSLSAIYCIHTPPHAHPHTILIRPVVRVVRLVS